MAISKPSRRYFGIIDSVRSNINGFENLPIEEQIALIQPTFCPTEDKRDVQNLNQNWVQRDVQNLNQNWVPGVTSLYYQLSDEKQMSSNSK